MAFARQLALHREWNLGDAAGKPGLSRPSALLFAPKRIETFTKWRIIDVEPTSLLLDCVVKLHESFEISIFEREVESHEAMENLPAACTCCSERGAARLPNVQSRKTLR